jgi:hypothetical protein
MQIQQMQTDADAGTIAPAKSGAKSAGAGTGPSGPTGGRLRLVGTGNKIRLMWHMLNVSESTKLTVRDLWGHTDLGTFTEFYEAEVSDAHGSAFVKLCV